MSNSHRVTSTKKECSHGKQYPTRYVLGQMWNTDVTVTVTDALVLCPLLEDRGRITESIRILVPIDRMKQMF